MRLKQIYHNCCETASTDGICLFSYESCVMKIEFEEYGKRKITFGRDYNYSKTTLKHISVYLKNFCNSAVADLIMNQKGKTLSEKIRNGIESGELFYDENL